MEDDDIVDDLDEDLQEEDTDQFLSHHDKVALRRERKEQQKKRTKNEE